MGVFRGFYEFSPPTNKYTSVKPQNVAVAASLRAALVYRTNPYAKGKPLYRNLVYDYSS